MADLNDFAIYLDLDGVLADYGAGMAALGYDIDPNVKKDLNRSGSSHPLKREMYERVKGTDFYRSLPLMEGALDLFGFCAEADPVILTAAPKFGAAEDDFHVNPYWLGAAYHKRAWVEQTLLAQYEWGPAGFRVPIADDRFICTTSARKWEFMHRKHSDHQVLIDDRIANVEAWAANGGIGILHHSAEQSIQALRLVLAEDYKDRRAGILIQPAAKGETFSRTIIAPGSLAG